MIGLIALNTHFPRPIGDVGNPCSWREPLVIEVLEGIGVADIVRAAAPTPHAVAACIAAGQRCVARGARVVTTSCGFLAYIQNALAAALPVPVVSSSLCLLPSLIAQDVSPNTVGVLTFDERALHADAFSSVGAVKPHAVVGLAPHSHLVHVIRNNHPTLSLAQASAEVLQASGTLRARFPATTTLLLECTNLGPYKNHIATHTGWRVHDIVDTVYQLTA